MNKLVLLTIVILMPLSLSAEPTNETKKVSKKQEVTFDAQDIDGQARSPEGAFLNPKKGVKFLPLYNVTNQLDREIKNSVEFVR